MKVEESSILIVDDEYSVRDSLNAWFRKDGYQTGTATNASEALDAMEQRRWDVVLLDIKMPGMDGMELLGRLREINGEMAVIMLTAFGAVDTAVKALKMGAFDYVTKPVDPDELSHLVRRAVEQHELRRDNDRLRRQVDALVAPGEIIGESRAMERVMEMVRSVADSDATVLIRGESGTGKELVAQAIHASSPRRYHPMVPVNCGALPGGLLESELFGHEKGAFTGAQFRRKGKFEMADGGTLFLDEIGTVAQRTQVDLLRVLETHEFSRLGGSEQVKVDLRVICATNQDLERSVREGVFREDLYFRVNVVSIVLPPLRERREDIPLLAQHFLSRFEASMSRGFTEFEPEALDMMVKYDWPGNVRELANAVERAIVIGAAPAIRAADLPLTLDRGERGDGGESLAEMERNHIVAVLERHRWNIKQSAEALKIDRATLYNKIKKYNLRD